MFRIPVRFGSQLKSKSILNIPLQHELRNPTRAFGSTTRQQSKLRAGDRVIFRWKDGKTSKKKISKPLRGDGETTVNDFIVKHKTIIGQQSDVRLNLISKDGFRRLNVFARQPTLDEFTSLAPRRVAPIYTPYTSTITSLLDIHVDPPSVENDPSSVGGPWFQILEAGTGHGSLTIQLAKSIAPANPVVTPELKPTLSAKQQYKAGEEYAGDVDAGKPAALEDWQKQRRAIVHTVDIDPKNREHADHLIRSFRNAMYWPHINFYAGNVADWINEMLPLNNNEPFLDIVVLDMPGVNERIAPAVKALKDGGQLLVFVPQITQIATCVQEIVLRNLGLKLEQVVELGDGVSDGRQWDVRLADVKRLRKRIQKQRTVVDVSEEATAAEAEAVVDAELDAERLAQSSEPASVSTIPHMVCRPIVGRMTQGGGFVGLWKRTIQSNEARD